MVSFNAGAYIFFFVAKIVLWVSYTKQAQRAKNHQLQDKPPLNTQKLEHRVPPPPDPNVLYSKLDQQPDEAWGWDSMLIRDPRQGGDPSRARLAGSQWEGGGMGRPSIRHERGLVKCR